MRRVEKTPLRRWTRELDIEQILLDARHRWLHPAEICDIIQNHAKIGIRSEAPHRPQSGSLFLFNRKVLRRFRKDGHKWEKKKDGKTVKEAHERLKDRSFDVVHCYYAHGEENRNFQRRSYWMLEEEISHIVLVHYREAEGKRTNFNRIGDANGTPDRQQTEEDISNQKVDGLMDGLAVSGFQPNGYQRASQVTDTTSFNRTPALERPEAQSDNYQGQFSAIPDMSFGSLTQGEKIENPTDNGLTYEFYQGLKFLPWENVLESSNAGHQSVCFPPVCHDPLQLPSVPLTQCCTMTTIPGQENELLDRVFTDAFRQEFGRHSDALEDWQASDHDSLNISNFYVDQMSDENLNLGQNTYYLSLNQPQSYDLPTNPDDVNHMELCDTVGFCYPYLSEQNRHPMQNDLQLQALNSVVSSFKSETDVKPYVEDKTDCPALRPRLLGDLLQEGMKMVDSFDSWFSKERGDVQSIEPSSGTFWETGRSEDGDDFGISTQVTLGWHIPGSSLSQD